MELFQTTRSQTQAHVAFVHRCCCLSWRARLNFTDYQMWKLIKIPNWYFLLAIIMLVSRNAFIMSILPTSSLERHFCFGTFVLTANPRRETVSSNKLTSWPRSVRIFQWRQIALNTQEFSGKYSVENMAPMRIYTKQHIDIQWKTGCSKMSQYF